MAQITRTNATNQDFLSLVKLLDTDLQLRDGEEHAFFAQFNSLDNIKYVVMAFDGDKAVGCGAMKEYSDGVIEFKRMFVKDEYRGRGIGSEILQELENWAIELSYLRAILETGKNQPEAIAMYKRNGYHIIKNFGQYKDVANSVCFEKAFVAG